MTTHNEVQTSSTLTEDLILVITNVGQSGDSSNVCRLPDGVDSILYALDDIVEDSSFSRRCDVWSISSSDADDGKLEFWVDMVRYDCPVQDWVVTLNVGRDDWESEVFLQVEVSAFLAGLHLS